MRSIGFRLSVTLLLSLLLSIPFSSITAQDDPQLTTVVDLSDGYVISVPDGWDVDEDHQTGGITLSDGNMTFFVLNPVQITEILDFPSSSLNTLLIDLYDELYNDRPRRRDVEEIEIGGREAASWSYEDGQFQGTFYVIRLNDDQPGAIDVYSEEVDLVDMVDLITAIVTSFNVADGGQVVSNAEPAEPCFISTTETDTVELRVGPGTNRSVIAYLEPGEEFPVVGRFTTDDGDVWYQLDKEEVLPNSAANEIWVAAENVDETGNCEAVVDASAPPIIPISNQPPPSNTGGDQTGDGSSGTPVSIIPRTGNWTVTLASTTTASCVGTDTITVDSSLVFSGSLSFTVYVSSVASDGSSLVLEGDTYVLQGNGYYVGPSLFNLIGLDNSQSYVMPTSSTTMVGMVIANVTISGRGCSQTTQMTLTHG